MGSYVSPDRQLQRERLSAVWEKPAPLFVYGSLLFPEVMHVLIGRDPERTPDVVQGWSVVAIPGKMYPGLVQDGRVAAPGHLLTDLTWREWRILDAFESDFYELRWVVTQGHAAAWVYAGDGGYGFSGLWDSVKFEQESLERYLKSCSRWRQDLELGDE